MDLESEIEDLRDLARAAFKKAVDQVRELQKSDNDLVKMNADSAAESLSSAQSVISDDALLDKYLAQQLKVSDLDIMRQITAIDKAEGAKKIEGARIHFRVVSDTLSQEPSSTPESPEQMQARAILNQFITVPGLNEPGASALVARMITARALFQNLVQAAKPL